MGYVVQGHSIRELCMGCEGCGYKLREVYVVCVEQSCRVIYPCVESVG